MLSMLLKHICGQMVGLLGRRICLSQSPYLHSTIQHKHRKKTYEYIHALNRIRTKEQKTQATEISRAVSAFQPAFLKIVIVPGFTKFWRKTTLFRFWLTGMWSCIICILQLEKIQVARVLGLNSGTCQLKCRVAWIQKNPANITTSAKVEVYDCKSAWFCVSS